ncbi:retention module-containing protein, partial [Polaromonas sp.]|uniref:retention module-containing protein n=1 Tax=Polaromonas sp. TaxID=1869339 RepID=UPI002489C00D
MAKEANVVGNVVLIEGIAFAQNSDGEQRLLKFGDPVFEGEVIVTAAGGRVELAFDQGGKFLLRSRETVTLDSTVFGNVLPDADSGALLPRVGELTSILNAISEGSSLDRLLQETSSGVSSASDAGGANIRADDGNNFVQLLRTAEELAPLTYEYASLGRQSLGYLPAGSAPRPDDAAGSSELGDQGFSAALPATGASVASVVPASDSAVVGSVSTLSSATAALTETNAVLTTGGTLAVSDLDATAATVVAQTGTAGSYGSFVINAAGAWTYTTSSALNNLNAGQTVTEVFTVTTTDGASNTVTVNITGSQDVSTLSSATAALTETNAVL